MPSFSRSCCSSHNSIPDLHHRIAAGDGDVSAVAASCSAADLSRVSFASDNYCRCCNFRLSAYVEGAQRADDADGMS